MKKQLKKTILKVFLSAAVILLVLVGAGIIYTWVIAKINPLESTVEQPPAVKSSAPAIIEPAKPAENVPVGVSVQSVTSPIAPGSNVTLIIRTRPLATCKITVVYDKVTSHDSGLADKKADDFGIVSWTWTVEDSVPVGKWPATVTCIYKDKSGMVIADLVVKK